MTLRKTLYIIIPAQLKSLSVLDTPITTLFQNIKGMRFDEETIYNIRLAIQELCTNIIRHAYRTDKGKIRLRIMIYEDPAMAVITSHDEGENTFDIDGWTAPDLESLPVHGLGAFLIHELMDEVIYSPCPGNNQWRLIKHLREPITA